MRMPIELLPYLSFFSVDEMCTVRYRLPKINDNVRYDIICPVALCVYVQSTDFVSDFALTYHLDLSRSTSTLGSIALDPNINGLDDLNGGLVSTLIDALSFVDALAMTA